jgi:predicted transcriptional regulator
VAGRIHATANSPKRDIRPTTLYQQKLFIKTVGNMSTKIVETITPSQCRAGRALLEITQTQLAKSAGLGLSTVVDFEKRRREVSPDAIQTICQTLIDAGVEFIEENGGGPGVRLRKRQRPKKQK